MKSMNFDWLTYLLNNKMGSSLEGYGVESLSLTSPIFHESFLLTPGFFPESEETSTPLMLIKQT